MARIPKTVKRISFRDEIPEIERTTYLTHGIYTYPAKFIPQVVRYAINTYTKPGDTVCDIFAGSGTVGLEAALCGRNAYLYDLSPLLNHIMPLKNVTDTAPLNADTLYTYVQQCLSTDTYTFMPRWSRIAFWYDQHILAYLTKRYGWLRHQKQNTYTRIIEAALVRLSMLFSYADDKIPKLCRSKQKIAYIEGLAQGDFVKTFEDMFYAECTRMLGDVNDLQQQKQDIPKSTITYKGGIDCSCYTFPKNVTYDLLITSPPYLQAQEYFRSLKLTLFWLGYDEAYVKSLAKLEIPYRKADTDPHTETLDKVYALLKNKKNLQDMVKSYFCHTLRSFEHALEHLKPEGTACIFVGEPSVDGNLVEIWRIIAEYFVARGYVVADVYEDVIQSRSLFSKRNNKNPDGMRSEYFLVLKKKA